jgi:ABC-type transport system substrate-binding protein
VKYGTTVSNLNAQTAELLKGYWKEIGVDTTIVQVPQDQYITKALFGDPDFEIFGWRQHGGPLIDAQYLWWHSSNAKDDGQLSLNFARLKDPIIDDNLDKARSEADPAKRQAYAEAINKEMVDKCWNLPGSWTLWGVPHKPAVQGLGELVLPDGSAENDNGGFFGLTGAWLDKAA